MNVSRLIAELEKYKDTNIEFGTVDPDNGNIDKKFDIFVTDNRIIFEMRSESGRVSDGKVFMGLVEK